MAEHNWSFEWLQPLDRVVYDSTGGDPGRLFLANEMRRLMDPYVPSEQVGILRSSARTYVKKHKGYIEYNTPYAHYQYEGILYVSSITGSSWAKAGEHKVKTNVKLKQVKTFHPLASAHWDKAMLVARKSDLVRSYQRYLRTL